MHMEIARGVHRIDRVRGANAYIFTDDQGAAVVDTGMPANEQKILAYARGIGLAPEGIKYIVITHSDIDHSGSAAKLRALTNAKVAVHQGDASRLSGEKKLKEVKGAMGVFFSLASPFMRFTPASPDLILKGGDNVLGLAVIHTPGHTDGSICLYQKDEAIFVGDALRTDSRGNPRLPPGPMTVDMEQAKESARKISTLPFKLLLPGHGPPMTRDASAAMVRFIEGGFA
jgi:glyoxylase-like metal-dependent hydrolase (beta-lactamase superfamily II)